jgi:hypothetical protein
MRQWVQIVDSYIFIVGAIKSRVENARSPDLFYLRCRAEPRRRDRLLIKMDIVTRRFAVLEVMDKNVGALGETVLPRVIRASNSRDGLWCEALEDGRERR